jgi:hypothetical protein
MLFLLLLGALVALHIRIGWRLENNRLSGSVMLAVNAVLVVTAFGLYYAGSETLRLWISDIHVAAGLALPTLLALHAVLGRRAVRAARRKAESGAAADHSPAQQRRRPVLPGGQEVPARSGFRVTKRSTRPHCILRSID